MMYGWYYEQGSVQDEGGDVWVIIDRAVPEAVDDGRLHALRVGEMHECSSADLFDEDDVLSMVEDGRLTAEEIVEVVSERHDERVYEGLATLDDAAAKPALRRIVQAHRRAQDAAPEIVRWVAEYVAVDPSVVCMGRHPLPIEFREGEWTFGVDVDGEPMAVITYASEPSPENGHIGWMWWALGEMGESSSLMDAMAAASSSMQRRMDDRIGVM